VSLLTQDLQVIGQATSSNLGADKMEIFYTQTDPKAVPAFVLVGTKTPGDHLYPFAPLKATSSDSSNVPFRQVIMGDFCLQDKPGSDGKCTTGLLTLDSSGNAANPPIPPVNQIKAYVQAADGTSKDATLNSIGATSAVVSFTASAGFKPAWLVLEGTNGGHTFAYTLAPPVQLSDLVYTSDHLENICTLGADNRPDCVNTVAGDLAPLKPIASDASATFVALQDHLLVAHIRAPMGLEPTAILVTNTKNSPHTSIIARRTLKPGQNTNLLNVDMTIVDQTTADRNFGTRIAKRYLAVTLDVKNPTAKKLQFNKSAVYFDVDYIEAKEKPSSWHGFYQDLREVSTLGMYTPSPYNPPFVETDHARLFRFGLEQNVKQSPISYLSVLGSYDETTENTAQDFDTVQLLASIMTTIATGGIAGTSQFKDASSLLSGVFLPGLKGILLNDSRINRRRANLVAQTLQEVIEVPASGSASTIVLLPRTGILAFSGAQIPVMIQRVLDVHLQTEVVTEVTGTPVEKGACKVGYTKEQTRDALGEPAGLTTNADGSSIFTYPKGPVTSASFNAAGSLVSCQQRSVSDQLAQAGTLVEMTETLTKLGLTVNRIGLTDGTTVLTDIPGVQQTFHFDAKGNKATDYTLLFTQIKSKIGEKKSDFDAFLETQSQALSATRSTDIKSEAQAAEKSVKTGASVQYKSPDVQNGLVVVTFKNSDSKVTTVSGTSLVDGITFQGDKPANAN
jgi:hypothetical protein